MFATALVMVALGVAVATLGAVITVLARQNETEVDVATRIAQLIEKQRMRRVIDWMRCGLSMKEAELVVAREIEVERLGLEESFQRSMQPEAKETE